MAKYCSILDENEGDGHCSNIALEGNVLCSKHLIEEFRTLTKHHHRGYQEAKRKLIKAEKERDEYKEKYEALLRSLPVTRG